MGTQDTSTSSDAKKKEIVRPPTFATKCRALLRATPSKEEFTRQYEKICDGKWKRKEFYILCVNSVKTTITEGDLETFKKLDTYIEYLNGIESKFRLMQFYGLRDNTIRSTNPVILACKYNQVEILSYMFSSSSKILNSLTVDIGRNAISFKDEDEDRHNAFYYSLRSNDVRLLNTLITMWPDNYLLAHLLELTEILSKAYEDLQLRRVAFFDQMFIFSEKQLLELRFFSDEFRQSPLVNTNFANVIERIHLVTDYASLLVDEYSEAKEVDDRFLFAAKCIALNIQVLKQQLKSTYSTIPWEEMEFCLISFITSFMERKETNLLCRVTLNKDKVVRYLGDFAKVLEDQRDFALFTELPKEERKIIKARIINAYPQFEQLYADHRKIREAYTLQRMSEYVRLALTFDPRPKSGQLAILRTLQVVSDCLKNTLDSPRLSDTVIKLLLIALSKETRRVVMDMRDSTSPAESLAIRLKVAEYSDATFFTYALDDLREIDSVIDGVTHEEIMRTLKVLLEKILKSESKDATREVIDLLNTSDMTLTADNFESYGVGHLDLLFEELEDALTTKTSDDFLSLRQIQSQIKASKKFRANDKVQYWRSFDMLKRVSMSLANRSKIDDEVYACMKNNAKETLSYINPPVDTPDVRQTAPQLHMLLSNVEGRLGHEEPDLKLRRMMCKISYLAEGRAGASKRFDRLWTTLKKKGPFKRFPLTKKNYDAFLARRVTELKNTMTQNAVINSIVSNSSDYRYDKRLQLVMEMLVLDVLDGLDDRLDDNRFFCVDSCATLTGRCLRDHLAHHNVIVDALLSDTAIMVALNATMLVYFSEDIINGKVRLGRRTVDDCLKLRHNYEKGLRTLALQEKMFAVPGEVRVDHLSTCIRAGAEMFGRNFNFCSPLHLAAAGTDVEVVRFVNEYRLNVHATNVHGETPLHVAAANGRARIVKCLIEESNCCVHAKDHCNRTPLHVAVENSHRDVVEILLAHRAMVNARDVRGEIPIQYAIRNNCLDIVKLLMEKDANICSGDGAKQRYYLMITAAESGSIDVLNFFIANKFDVRGRNMGGHTTPLHLATLRGHLEVAQALIANGADVNVNVKEAGTPLYCAAHDNREAIAELLLKHGANPNVANDEFNNSALHIAARLGHKNMVLCLLKHGADANFLTTSMMTPLHVAIQGGHLEVIDALVRHGADVNLRNAFDWTPLASAASRGHKDIVDLLIKKGAVINTESTGFAPLHGAVEAKRLEIVKLLMKNKADVHLKAKAGMAPLHVAAATPNNEKVIRFLLNKKASIDAETTDLMTPLHMAIASGCLANVSVLVRYKANVNALTVAKMTPLHLAVSKGHKEIVQLLVKNKAVVNTDPKILRPLNIAVGQGHEEIVEILLNKGAKITETDQDLTMFLSACTFNYTGIVDLLMRNGIQKFLKWASEGLIGAIRFGRIETVQLLLRLGTSVTIRYASQSTVLHVAARIGYVNIVDALISRGADVNVAYATNQLVSPLHLAAQQGHERVVKSLLANGARANVKTSRGESPLHLATEMGHHNVVKLLLDNGASINEKNGDKRVPLELAVMHDCVQVVQTLLRYKKFDLNADYSRSKLLHIASRIPSLKMVKYLVDEGADVHVKSSSGSKAIHVAAGKDVTEYFLGKGVSVDEVDVDGRTPLHYAVLNERLEIVQCLIDHGADVNARTESDKTPLDMAVTSKSKAIVKLLLENDAIGDCTDELPSKMPILEIAKLLILNKKLLDAVRRGDANRTWQYIKQGAVVDVRDAKNLTPLHHAAQNGYHEITRILLENGARVDALGGGRTPLHYAAKYSHLKVVKTLLANGAAHNVPLFVVRDGKIKHLLRLISRSFRTVKEDDVRIVFELQVINDVDTIMAVMNARNEDGETLLVVATRSRFSSLDALKNLLPSCTIRWTVVDESEPATNDHEDFNVFENTWDGKRRPEAKSVSALDDRLKKAETLYDQRNYSEALTIYEDVSNKQNETLGEYHKSTLRTRSRVALTLSRLGRYSEAFSIYHDLYKTQLGRSGVCDLDLIKIQFQIAVTLCNLKQYQSTFDILLFVYQKRRNILGPTHLSTLRVLKCMATMLWKRGTRDAALHILQCVLKKERTRYGPRHVNSFQTLYNIATIYSQKEMYKEALANFKELLALHEPGLGPNHPDTLIVQHRIIKLYVKLGKISVAIRRCATVVPRMVLALPSDDPTPIELIQLMRDNGYSFKDTGTAITIPESSFHRKINIAAATGDVKVFEEALAAGYEVIYRDSDGETPLHFAASGGHVEVIKLLLDNNVDVDMTCNRGKTPLFSAVINNRTEVVDYLLENKADVNVICSEGKTPLHVATEHDHENVVELLLKHIRRDKLSDYINVKNSISGATSLHIAAQNNNLDIVFCLLRHGAMYNVKDLDGRTPRDHGKDDAVVTLLQVIDELFDEAKTGDTKTIVQLDVLKKSKPGVFSAVTNARNVQGNTVLQVAISNRRKVFASALLQLLK